MTEKEPASQRKGGGGGTPAPLGDEGVASLEEARRVIRDLRERHRHQSYQLLVWRRRFKQQEEQVMRVNAERNEQLKKLSAQLMLFEARLMRKQRDISRMLASRELLIGRQAKVIKDLKSRLSEAGLSSDTAEETCLDSLNDSDSAVILEDDDNVLPHHNGVTVIRSVSDALETHNSSKYMMLRSMRSMCLLRRPEILETVYSVEEDADGDENQNKPPDQKGDDHQKMQPPTEHLNSHTQRPKLKEQSGNIERLDPPNEQESQQPSPVTTYNRVMLNHRSVTKPKDVKYKRINKAKSKSLEELRGRLKNWVDRGNKIAASLDHSLA